MRIATFIIFGVDIMLIYFHIYFGFPLPIQTPQFNEDTHPPTADIPHMHTNVRRVSVYIAGI